MNENDKTTPQSGDVKPAARWYQISPALKLTLACALGFYAALLLNAETQHWIATHQFDALRAILAVLGEHVLALLWGGAAVVTALAILEARRASRGQARDRSARALRTLRVRLARSMRLAG
jgi:hypothetical protein